MAAGASHPLEPDQQDCSPGSRQVRGASIGCEQGAQSGALPRTNEETGGGSSEGVPETHG